MTRKGVFCYDYLDSYDKLNDCQLPPKENFYNNLTQSHISDEDYRHALKVWDTFRIETLRDYAETYLTSDVLLLCDIMENFRDLSLEIYQLDPCYYTTLPALAFDAMLRTT